MMVCGLVINLYRAVSIWPVLKSNILILYSTMATRLVSAATSLANVNILPDLVLCFVNPPLLNDRRSPT